MGNPKEHYLSAYTLFDLKAMIKAIYALLLISLVLMFGCQKNPYKQGETLYKFHCESCHMADGSGLASLIPPLNSSILTLSDPEKLVCLIRTGLPVNEKTGQRMPQNTTLNDVEMTNLVNFLGFKYSKSPQTVQVQDVNNWMLNCQSNER